MTDVNYENIERYLSGGMTEKERHNFEVELDENEELAQELHFYRYVNQSITECLKNSTDFPLSKSGNSIAKKKWQMSTTKWIAIIAIPLILGVFLIWFLGSPTRLTEASTVKMGTVNAEGIPVGNKYADIIETFNAGNYEEVLALLNGALAEEPDDLYIKYYRGVTFLNLKYLGSARRDLLKVYTENSAQMYEAAYYIALSYTEEDDDYTESALNWLAKIPKESPMYGKAQTLAANLK